MASSVQVTKITIPNTIEDRIVELQERKQELMNMALSEGNEMGGNRAQRLSRNELIYLFRGGRPPLEAE
jgi:SNF2 family DNA or RNA helicase